MNEMRSSNPTHFATTQHPSLDTLGDRPPSLAVVRVNLDGVLYTLHAALAYFRAQDKDADGWRGKFVATGSNACAISLAHLSLKEGNVLTEDARNRSFYPFPNDPLYAASKQGVLGTCRAVGPKVIDEGITVKCVLLPIHPDRGRPSDLDPLQLLRSFCGRCVLAAPPVLPHLD